MEQAVKASKEIEVPTTTTEKNSSKVVELNQRRKETQQKASQDTLPLDYLYLLNLL